MAVENAGVHGPAPVTCKKMFKEVEEGDLGETHLGTEDGGE